MKISIDTSEDPPEHIRKVVTMLRHLLGEAAAVKAAAVEEASPASSGEGDPQEATEAVRGFLGLFDDEPAQPYRQPADPEVPHFQQPVERSPVFKVQQEEKRLDLSKHIVPYE